VTSSRDDWDDEEREALAPVARELAAMRARHAGDPPLDLLRAAGADALPEALQGPTRAHLESSAWSRALVDGADTADSALDDAAAERLLARTKVAAAQETGARRRHGVRWTPIAALAAAAAVIAAIGVWRNAARAPSPSVAHATERPTVPAPPSPAPPRREFRLALTKPAVKLTAAALLLRGAGNPRSFVDDMADGLNAYRDGDYEKAARELEALRPRYPASIEIPFYAGVSRLMLGDAPAAVRALEAARALNDDTFADDVAWYLAVAYERAAEADKSRPLVVALCRGSSSWTAQACAAAETLK
jgi:hypothetical protein